MRISHKYRFIFFAIPRTGSTTTRSVLDEFSDVKSLHITQLPPGFPFYHHISPLEVKIIFDKEGLSFFDYRRFCVVRNPYDRVVSLYHHHQRMKTERFINARIFKKFLYKINDVIRPTTTFRDYVMQINPAKREPTSIKSFISDNKGHLLINDILKFENLGEELPTYLANFGIQINADNVPHLNASENRQDYRVYYDEVTKQRVSNLYSYEIERFDYSF